MKTYPGKILMSRPMQLGRAEHQPAIEIEVTDDEGRIVVNVEVPEEHVARMLLGSMTVPCSIDDYTKEDEQ